MEPRKNTTYRVWRALDAETSYFGIRGRFLMLFLLMAGAALALTLMVWASAGDLTGMIFGALALISCYLAVQTLQNRYTSREFERMLSGRRCTEYLRMLPVSLRQHLKSNDIQWK